MGVVLHPFILAALLLAAAFSQISEVVLWEEVLPALVVLELVAAILLGLYWLFFRDILRAGIACSFSLALLFAFRPLYEALEPVFYFAGQPAAALSILSIYLLMCAGIIVVILQGKWKWGTRRASSDPAKLNRALNVVSACLLFLNGMQIVAMQWQEESLARKYVAQFQAEFAQIKLNAAAGRPDVYYILADGFPNSASLKEFWGYDNSEFIVGLKKRGFYVVDKAASNYDQTQLSLSSSLNMQYLSDINQKGYTGEALYWRLIQDNVVVGLLKQLGYKFVNVSSGCSATDSVPQADSNIRCQFLNNFALVLAFQTPLLAIEQCYPLLRNFCADIRLCPRRCLPQVVSIRGPKFVLLHTDLPHGPCIFDEKGGSTGPLSRQLLRDWGTPTLLVGQVKFVQKELLSWIDIILAQPGSKPIIILQSDHGPALPVSDWANQRMRILNAYYFPSGDYGKLYPSITPINGFRVLFNQFFQAQLNLLEDQSWCSPDVLHRQQWQNVKTKLRF